MIYPRVECYNPIVRLHWASEEGCTRRKPCTDPDAPYVCCLVWGARINSEESEGEAPCALRYIAIPSISKATVSVFQLCVLISLRLLQSPSSSCVCLSISLRLLLF
ncbi:mCG1041507, isoform CRA_b [Mus musculus]|nr:mCG1041507, isoform CRA_b [Mus musculus]